MKKKLFTESDLRAHWFLNKETTLELDGDIYMTPAARDFMKEKGITLHFKNKKDEFGCMPISHSTDSKTGVPFINAATGEGISIKPESMTHLYGNVLVPKNHPRIILRGKLDSLEAWLINVQRIAEEEGFPKIVEELEELLAYVRVMLGSEVRKVPMKEVKLLNLNSEELRHVSHNVKAELGIDHPVPNYRMGRLCIALNGLRTQVREAEIAAVIAFCDGNNCSRPDIIEGINRLSSCVYIIFCRKLAGWYGRK